MRFFRAEWRPGERFRVYGGSARNDCRIYTRESDSDAVGNPTKIVGRHDELEKYAHELNILVGYKGPLEDEEVT
jgi:hypothetical protein